MPRLLALALLCGGAAARGVCGELESLGAHANPALWAPALILRSLRVRPDTIQPPPRTRQGAEVRLEGACEPARFRADTFVWQRPTSDGGDWIASVLPNQTIMQISVDGVSCALTAVAITISADRPSLRLQFDACPRTAALQVPLVNASAGNMQLVRWLCAVSSDTRLCTDAERLEVGEQGGSPAAAGAWSTTAGPTPSGDEPVLDLSGVARAASLGVKRTQATSGEGCFEAIDWFTVSTPVGVDAAEFDALLAIMSRITPAGPSFPPTGSSLEIPADIVLETVCIPECQGLTAKKCAAKPPPRSVPEEVPAVEQAPVVEPAPAVEPEGAVYFGNFTYFAERSSDGDILPWLAGFILACFFLGSCMACCCMASLPSKSQQRERKIKTVSVVYQEVPGKENVFFSAR